MKRILIGLAIGFASLSAVADVEQFPFDPETFCKSGCTETMKQIVTDFREQGTLPDLSAAPLVGSGACFHIQRGVDPAYNHHGLAILDPNGGAPLFQGMFSFFAKQDPWAGMSFEQASAIAKQRGSQPTETSSTEKDVRVRFKSASADLFYWIREIPAKNEVLMISIWTYNQATPDFAFCRMNRH